MPEVRAQWWKVGELADATGLTVRTLHHWGELVASTKVVCDRPGDGRGVEV